jgi:hypothetical protein
VTLLITDFTYLLITVIIKSKCNVSFINVMRKVGMYQVLSIVAVSFEGYNQHIHDSRDGSHDIDNMNIETDHVKVSTHHYFNSFFSPSLQFPPIFLTTEQESKL